MIAQHESFEDTDLFAVSEELLEAFDEGPDIGARVCNCGEGELSSRIAERWMNHQSLLHVHLRVRPRLGKSQADDLCLTFARKRLCGETPIHKLRVGVPGESIPNTVGVGEEHLNGEGAVLVNIGQHCEHRKGMVQGVLTEIPAVVRLLALDSCPDRPVYFDALQGAFSMPCRGLRSGRLGRLTRVSKSTRLT